MPLTNQNAQIEPDRPSTRWRLWLGVLIALPLIVFACAVVEYQTNWTATRIGEYLVQTNPARSSTGSIWSRLTSEDRARDAITVDELQTTTNTGLPVTVSSGTYSIERIPPSGLPTFLALEYQPVLSTDHRDTRDLINAHRIFVIGQRLLTNAHFEVTISETAVSREVERTIEQSGGFATSPGDTIHIDSVRADIVRTVSDVIREQRRLEEAERIRSAYLTGQVNQIFLNQMMGAYRGELYEDGLAGSLPFTIDTDAVATILGIVLQDGEDP